MEWAYLAGFFDGEGSIVRQSKSSCKISFSQNYLPVLEEIKLFLEDYDIYSWVSSYTNKNRQYNASYQLQFSASPGVKLFLTNVLPYLIVKAEKAEEALSIIPSNPKPRARLEDVKDEIRSLRILGLTYSEIIEETGVSRGTIQRAIGRTT